MRYRVEETCFGPSVRYNDWSIQKGRKERGGGALRLFAP